MKQFIFLISAVAMSISFAGADEAKSVSIFNGKDLDGWDGRAGAWEVRDGEIWCTGTATEKNWLIWRKKEPGDFILKLEFRWKAGNSGVQVRSDDLGDHQVYGYQVEVARQEVMGLWHHSLLAKEHPRKEQRHLMALAGEIVTLDSDGGKEVEVIGDGEEVKELYLEDDWNTLEIMALGDTLLQKINGFVFSTVIDNDETMLRKKGFIALQDHGKGCVVGFRNIKLEEFP